MDENQFLLETGGSCFICLSSKGTVGENAPVAGNSDGGNITTGSKGRGRPSKKGLQEVRKSQLSPVRTQATGDIESTEQEYEGECRLISLQEFANHLKLDFCKVFKESVAISDSQIPELETSELISNLCGGCSQLCKQFSEDYEQLVKLSMKVQNQLGSIQRRMKSVNDNQEQSKKFRTKMWSRPQTILHYGLVQRMRKETLEKCGLLLQRVGPKVVLTRVNETESDSTESKNRKPDVTIKHEDDEDLDQNEDRRAPSSKSSASGSLPPQLIEERSVPIISSVRGNFRIKSGGPVVTRSFVNKLSQSKSPRHQRAKKSMRNEGSIKNNEEGADGDADVCFPGLFPIPVEVEVADIDVQPKQLDRRDGRTNFKRKLSEAVNAAKGNRQRKTDIGSSDTTPLPSDITIKKSKTTATVTRSSAASNLSLSAAPANDLDQKSEEKPSVFKCNRCFEQFPKKYLMTDHISTVHEGRLIPCHKCSSLFKSRADLYQHKRSAHKFTNAIPRLRSRRSINARRRRKQYAVIVTNEEATPSKNQRKKIKKTDTGKEPFVAVVIPKKKINKNPPPPPIILPKPNVMGLSAFSKQKKKADKTIVFKCKSCTESFQAQYLLVDHYRSVHLGKKMYCTLCKPRKSFDNRKDYSTHYRRYHMTQPVKKRKNKDAPDQSPPEKDMVETEKEQESAETTEAIPIAFRLENGEMIDQQMDFETDIYNQPVVASTSTNGYSNLNNDGTNDSDSSAEEMKLVDTDKKIRIEEQQADVDIAQTENTCGAGANGEADTLASSSSSIYKKFKCESCSKKFSMLGALNMHLRKSTCNSNGAGCGGSGSPKSSSPSQNNTFVIDNLFNWK